ncbi:hypothetical protein L1049_007510 [Liquidambar formosana]|uniref:Uncharacterized protein n=1 Tax=Liquidambar formosana TaxID=63359 RepID=A0AAP0S8A9_LIQFO
MASSSRSVNSGTGRGTRYRFQNRRCQCGRKAEVKISESIDNPEKLYFRCQECGFFEWWYAPIDVQEGCYDFVNELRREINGNYKELGREIDGNYNRLRKEIDGLKFVVYFNTIFILFVMFILFVILSRMN